MARLSHPNVVAVYDVGRARRAGVHRDGAGRGRRRCAAGWRRGRARWREILDVFVAGRPRAGRRARRRPRPPRLQARQRAGRRRRPRAGHRLRPGPPVDADAARDAGATRVPATRRSRRVDRPLTRTGALRRARRRYMAPEQLARRPRRRAHRSVQLLRRALRGALRRASLLEPGAAPGGTGGGRHDRLDELLRALAVGKLRPPPPRSRVPSWLHRLLERGMSVNPKARWPKMDDLIAALAQQPAPRRRLAPVAAAALLGAIVAAIGLAERSWLTTARPVTPAAPASPAVASPPAVGSTTPATVSTTGPAAVAIAPAAAETVAPAPQPPPRKPGGPAVPPFARRRRRVALPRRRSPSPSCCAPRRSNWGTGASPRRAPWDGWRRSTHRSHRPSGNFWGPLLHGACRSRRSHRREAIEKHSRWHPTDRARHSSAQSSRGTHNEYFA